MQLEKKGAACCAHTTRTRAVREWLSICPARNLRARPPFPPGQSSPPFHGRDGAVSRMGRQSRDQNPGLRVSLTALKPAGGIVQIYLHRVLSGKNRNVPGSAKAGCDRAIRRRVNRRHLGGPEYSPP